MSKETKLGLLISLGVILIFAMIISIHLSQDEHADMGARPAGAHVAQHEVRTGHGEAPPPEPAPAASTEGGPEMPVRDELAAEDGPPAPRTQDGVAVTSYDDEDDTMVMATDYPGSRQTEVIDEAVLPEPVGDRESPEPEPREVAARRYTVRRGDSLFSIAERIYGPGHGNKWRRIVEANPGVDPDRLAPGTELVIPTDAPAPSRPPDRPSPRGPDREASDVYVVAQGDTLGEISTKVYGTCKKWQLIRDANGVNPQALRVGTKLVIPRDGERVAREGDGSEQVIDKALDEVRRFVADNSVQTPYSEYTVASGDTLWSISRKQFGDSARWKELLELNRDRLPQPEALRVGQVLRVPATTRTAMGPAAGVH